MSDRKQLHSERFTAETRRDGQGLLNMTAHSLRVCVRYEKQLQEEELSLQQQRRRLYKEVADEKERLAQLSAR